MTSNSPEADDEHFIQRDNVDQLNYYRAANSHHLLDMNSGQLRYQRKMAENSDVPTSTLRNFAAKNDFEYRNLEADFSSPNEIRFYESLEQKLVRKWLQQKAEKDKVVAMWSAGGESRKADDLLVRDDYATNRRVIKSDKELFEDGSKWSVILSGAGKNIKDELFHTYPLLIDLSVERNLRSEDSLESCTEGPVEGSYSLVSNGMNDPNQKYDFYNQDSQSTGPLANSDSSSLTEDQYQNMAASRYGTPRSNAFPDTRSWDRQSAINWPSVAPQSPRDTNKFAFLRVQIDRSTHPSNYTFLTVNLSNGSKSGDISECSTTRSQSGEQIRTDLSDKNPLLPDRQSSDGFEFDGEGFPSLRPTANSVPHVPELAVTTPTMTRTTASSDLTEGHPSYPLVNNSSPISFTREIVYQEAVYWVELEMSVDFNSEDYESDIFVDESDDGMWWEGGSFEEFQVLPRPSLLHDKGQGEVEVEVETIEGEEMPSQSESFIQRLECLSPIPISFDVYEFHEDFYNNFLLCKSCAKNNSGNNSTDQEINAADKFELARLLSFQQLHFGVNMFEDLRQGDPRFARYLRKGFSHADAALKVFLEKYSPRLKSVRSMKSTASTATMTESDMTSPTSKHDRGLDESEELQFNASEQIMRINMLMRDNARLLEDAALKKRIDYSRQLKKSLEERTETVQLKQAMEMAFHDYKEQAAQNAADLKWNLAIAEESLAEAVLVRDRLQADLAKMKSLLKEEVDRATEKIQEIERLRKERDQALSMGRINEHNLKEAIAEIRRLKEALVSATVTKNKSPTSVADITTPIGNICKTLFVVDKVEKVDGRKVDAVRTTNEAMDPSSEDKVFPSNNRMFMSTGFCSVALLVLYHCLMAALIVWLFNRPNTVSFGESNSQVSIPPPTLLTDGECIEYTLQIPIPVLPTAGSASSQLLADAVELAVLKFFNTDQEYLGL